MDTERNKNRFIASIQEVQMLEIINSSRRSTNLEQIKEIYRDHPYMRRVNAFKEQLKQEKLQDKAFCQSIKNKRNHVS